MNTLENTLQLDSTLLSGQCFRFSEKNGVWTVRAGVGRNVRVLEISQDRISVIENNPFWNNYFDMQTDYGEIKKQLCKISPVMETAISYAPGIRILRQDCWEALASFVVSQNNNIKRIMKIIENLCITFGEKNEDGIAGFPTPEALADAPSDRLRETGLGFRDSYIKNTAAAVLDGRIDFNALKTGSVESARKMLMAVKGIGIKVADCALLFGCHRTDCFPLDVWMKRVMEQYFNSDNGSVFGQYRGIAQQYLFHWIRMTYRRNG